MTFFRFVCRKSNWLTQLTLKNTSQKTPPTKLPTKPTTYRNLEDHSQGFSTSHRKLMNEYFRSVEMFSLKTLISIF